MQIKEIYTAKNNKKPLYQINDIEASALKRRLPTLPLLRSTIGVIGLNFSVRNGKRWNPNAIVTLRRLDMM